MQHVTDTKYTDTEQKAQEENAQNWKKVWTQTYTQSRELLNGPKFNRNKDLRNLSQLCIKVKKRLNSIETTTYLNLYTFLPFYSPVFQIHQSPNKK